MAGVTGWRGAVLAAAAVAAGAAAAAEPSGSLAGAYLAARQADARQDVAAAAAYYRRALARDPGDSELMESALLALLAAGDVAEGARVAGRLAALDPAHRLANLALAVADAAAGRHGEARARVAAAPDAFHPVLAALIDGWSAFALGDRAGADAALAALDTWPVFRVFAVFHRGLMRAAAGEADAAAEAFAQAAGELSGRNGRVTLAQGAALEAAGRADAARILYRAADGAGLGDPEAARALARLEAGAPPEPLVRDAAEGVAEALYGLAGVLAGDSGRRFALAYAQLALHLRPRLDNAALLIGELFEADGQPALAIGAYGRVDPAGPLAVAAAIGRAGAMEATGDVDAAIATLAAAAAAAPEDPAARMASGDALRRAERWEDCAAAYGSAIDLMSARGRETWTLYYQRGVCHERAGLWDLAEPDFLRALDLEPDQPLVLNYLGYSWVEQHRHLDRARAMIERAVELRPQDGYITDSLGWVLYRLGDYPGAVEWLEKAVGLTPDDPVINDHLGDALWKVGRRREAEFQWRRARSFDPAPEDLARIKRKLTVGLDAVLDEERAARPAAAAGQAAAPDGG